MTIWKTYKLREVAEITTGFPFKGDKYSDEGIRVVRGENVTIGTLRWDTIKCWNEPFEQFEKYSLKDGDIVIGMDGSRVGRNRAQIRKSELPLLLAQRVACVRARNGFSQDLISFIIKSKKFEQYVNLVHTGTSIPHISQTQIEEFDLIIPDNIIIQRVIAEILSSLDDKIELNNQMNKTLEEMAQAVFNEMCSFEDEIPDGWNIKQLGDIIEVKGGTTPSTKNPEYWDGEINWTSPKDLSNIQFPVLLDTNKKITELGLKKIGSGLLPKGTLLLSSRAPIGYLAISNIPVAINQGYIAILCTKKVSNYFMLFWLKQNMNKVLEKANGSTFLAISKTNFKQREAIVPDKNILKEFDKHVKELFDMIVLNEIQNQKLKEIRDFLLPKLMSGAIDVSEAKTIIENPEQFAMAAEPELKYIKQ